VFLFVLSATTPTPEEELYCLRVAECVAVTVASDGHRLLFDP
jgi:hypothetical protein